MSRIGKKPIQILSNIKVACSNGLVSVEGPKGKLSMNVDPRIVLNVEGTEVKCTQKDSNVEGSGALVGLTRSLVANMIQGCASGFSKDLEINGTGYRANVKGKDLELSLGFSHQVLYPIPEGISIVVDKLTKLTVSGADKRLVGQTAAEIRMYRKPEPYKGKGVKYSSEVIVRKAGKAAGAGK